MHDIDTDREPKDVGRLVGIFIAPERGAPPVARDAATAVVGRGLAGDRYYHGTGTFSARAGLFAGARELSLIDAAAVERCNARLRAAGAREVGAGDLRRNLVIAGLDLRAHRGRTLVIGAVHVVVRSTCPPCGYLGRRLGVDMRSALRGIGGVRAAVARGGRLAVGMPVSGLDDG